MTIKGLLKKCISEEVPCGFFLWTVIVNRGNSFELKAKKTFLSCVNGQIYFNFRSFETYKPRITFQSFTFVSQHRLLELLSYGEYNHLFPLLVFLKQLIYLSSFLVIHFFFSFRKNVDLHHFSEVEKYWLQQNRFENTE